MSYEIPKITDIIARTEKGAIETKIKEEKKRADEYLKWKLDILDKIQRRADYGENELRISTFATSYGLSLKYSKQYTEKFMKELKDFGYEVKFIGSEYSDQYIVNWPKSMPKSEPKTQVVVGTGENTVFGNSNLIVGPIKNAVVTVSDNAVIGQNVNSNEIPSIEKIVAQTEEALKKRTEFNNKTYEEYMKDAIRQINECANGGIKSCHIGFKILSGKNDMCPYATKLMSNLMDSGYNVIRLNGQILVNW